MVDYNRIFDRRNKVQSSFCPAAIEQTTCRNWSIRVGSGLVKGMAILCKFAAKALEAEVDRDSRWTNHSKRNSSEMARPKGFDP